MTVSRFGKYFVFHRTCNMSYNTDIAVAHPFSHETRTDQPVYTGRHFEPYISNSSTKMTHYLQVCLRLNKNHRSLQTWLSPPPPSIPHPTSPSPIITDRPPCPNRQLNQLKDDIIPHITLALGKYSCPPVRCTSVSITAMVVLMSPHSPANTARRGSSTRMVVVPT